MIPALSSAADGVWKIVRSAGRGVLGEKRFDALVGALGLRGFKARWFRYEKLMPDGTTLRYRADDEHIIDEVYADRVYDRDAPLLAGQTVIDVGGHIGAFALYAARKVGENGRVVAFEPSPDNFELLDANADANALKQLRVLPVALSDKAGTAELFVAEPGSDNPAADTLFATEGRRGVTVALLRLDDVSVDVGLEGPIDLLKIDVEGAELSVLRGAAKVLARTKRIVMEVHPARVKPEDVFAVLRGAGFTVRELQAKPLIVEARR